MTSKSVRFEASVLGTASKNGKRSRSDSHNSNADEKCKRVRLNEDEIDDVGDWKREESDGEEEIPSERELLEAKRQRRRQRAAGVDADGRTHIDDSTSLATDGIQIEPFHMKREESDGTGYFDGDTYIWRKHDPNDEPDAWLDSLDDESNSTGTFKPREYTKDSEDKTENLDNLAKEDLYLRILPLMNGNETVAQAVRRYGNVSKQNKLASKKRALESDEAHNKAKECLYDLTGAANALLLKGEVNIYDTRRQWILQFVSKQTATEKLPNGKEAPANWEYKGNQDGELHGPFTTQQMIDWMQAGYFVGLQKVRIRTIRKKKLSTKDDLMADLMDDEEKADSSDDTLEKGEWQWSDEIKMENYLP